MSLNRIGKMAGSDHPLFGKPRSDETKEKISKANKGKITSDAAKEKISKANKGKIRSDSVKEKISKANKGKIISEEAKIKISIAIKKLWENNEYRESLVSQMVGRKQSKSSVLKRSGNNSKLSKLKKDQVLEIIEKYNTGKYSHRKLALEYGVSHRQIGYILTGKSWKNIKE